MDLLVRRKLLEHRRPLAVVQRGDARPEPRVADARPPQERGDLEVCEGDDVAHEQAVAPGAVLREPAAELREPALERSPLFGRGELLHGRAKQDRPCLLEPRGAARVEGLCVLGDDGLVERERGGGAEGVEHGGLQRVGARREERGRVGVRGVEVLGDRGRVDDAPLCVRVKDHRERVVWPPVGPGGRVRRVECAQRGFDVWVLDPLGRVRETLVIESIARNMGRQCVVLEPCTRGTAYRTFQVLGDTGCLSLDGIS